MKSALLPTNKWPSRVDVTETDVVFAVPGGLPHAVKEDALQLGPYRVSRGHFLLGDFQESISTRNDSMRRVEGTILS